MSKFSLPHMFNQPLAVAAAGLAVTASLVAVNPAEAVVFNFGNISNNNAINAGIGEAQLSVDVTDAGGGQALFTFLNSGPDASSITQIYWDDDVMGGILGSIFSIDESDPGVDYQIGGGSPNLPAGNQANPSFGADFRVTPESPVQPNGINPGETLGVVFNLTGSFDDLIMAMNDAELRVGIHVQGFANGGSESFVNEPPPAKVPEPAAMAGLAVVALAGAVKRRQPR